MLGVIGFYAVLIKDKPYNKSKISPNESSELVVIKYAICHLELFGYNTFFNSIIVYQHFLKP